jgi:pilus assembly protein CpaF
MFSKYKRQTPAAKLAPVAADNGANSDVGAAPGATGVHDDEICARQGGRRPARQEKAQERLKRHPAEMHKALLDKLEPCPENATEQDLKAEISSIVQESLDERCGFESRRR